MTPYVVAEVAQGYEGESGLVKLFVSAAAAAGADAVKFQVFFADELALPDYQHYPLFERLQLPAEVWTAAVAQAHDAGLEFLSDVFGPRSLEVLEAAGADGYKVHATDIDNVPLIRAVAATRKRVLVACGGATLEELDDAVAALEGCDVTLLYGFQAEPTKPEDLQLGKIAFLAKRYGKPVGFMDHTEGATTLAWSLPFAAMALGATLIEKHMTLSRTARLEDHISAMTVDEFAPWAADLRLAAGCLGPPAWEVTRKEQEYRQKVRREIVARRDIAAGSRIEADDLVRLRTGDPGAIVDGQTVIGRIAARKIAAGAAIHEGDLT